MHKKLINLLKRIDETEVRLAIESELGRSRGAKKFGLVFENHQPEVLLLRGKTPRRGDFVSIKEESLSEIWRVNSVKNSVAKIARDELVDDVSALVEKNVELDKLVVVKRFGDPIYPALLPVDSVENEPSGDHASRHAIIEADNFHALQLLRYIYRGKVDCIYIDPPYNTGARDWKYNNDYVDLSDSWRHSKWLSFMEKRLLLAKDLLNQKSSVLIVTIDEHEVHHLACLLGEVFPSARRQMVTIVNNGAGVSQGGFYRVEEYAIFCFLGDAKPNPGPDDLLSDVDSEPLTPYWFSLIRYGGVNAVPSKRDNLVYPIGIDPATLKIVGAGPTLRDRVEAGDVARASDDWLPEKSETLNSFPVVWPYRGNGRMATWQMSPDTLMDLQEKGFVRVRRHKNGPGGNQYSISYVKSGNRAKVADGSIPILGREDSGALKLGQSARNVISKTVWRRARHDAGKWGSRILRETLGEVAFDYAKSPYAVLDCLSAAVGQKKDALIVDFFAGSGTTLLSTLLLNERDQGRRRCVLVTNNEVSLENSNVLTAKGKQPGDQAWEELGICRSVTWPRARNTVLGKRNDGTALEGEYFDVRFSERECERAVTQLGFAEGRDLSPKMRKDLLKIIGGMASGDLGDKHYCFSKDKLVAVLFDVDDLDGFLSELENYPNLEQVFVITPRKLPFSNAKEAITGALGPKILSSQQTVPMSRGFATSVEYYKLDFLEPGAVSAGQAFSAILPILWMMSGCEGPCPGLPSANARWLFAETSNFCVLMQERYFNAFLTKLIEQTGVQDRTLTFPKYIFLVTDEDDSFNAWRKQILAHRWPPNSDGNRGPVVVQLYRNYLDNFRLQVSTTRRGK